MGKLDGKFVLESQDNVGPCMLALGMPEAEVKTMLDPANEVCVTVCENNDGSFTTSSKNSLATQFNMSSTFKVGERTEMKEPFPHFFTITKKNENTWINRVEMGGKVMVTESTVHNYGMSVRGTVEGTACAFKEEFKKVSPKISGYYVFESENGMEKVVKLLSPQMTGAEWDKFKHTMEVRVVDKGDGMCVDERYGGKKKVYSVKYDEEFDFCDADWKVDDKRVVTKISPGSYLTVCKAKKDGKVTEYTTSFTDCGVEFHMKIGALEGVQYYKRVTDIEGTWKGVAQCGIDGYLDCLGITGSQKAEMIADMANEVFTEERIGGGKLRNVNNSKFMPNELVIKLDESYTMDMPGFGSIECVTTELGETFITVMKFNGKTIAMNQKISGDFMVVETCVDGNPASRFKAIYTRC